MFAHLLLSFLSWSLLINFGVHGLFNLIGGRSLSLLLHWVVFVLDQVFGGLRKNETLFWHYLRIGGQNLSSNICEQIGTSWGRPFWVNYVGFVSRISFAARIQICKGGLETHWIVCLKFTSHLLTLKRRDCSWVVIFRIHHKSRLICVLLSDSWNSRRANFAYLFEITPLLVALQHLTFLEFFLFTDQFPCHFFKIGHLVFGQKSVQRTQSNFRLRFSRDKSHWVTSSMKLLISTNYRNWLLD